MAKTKELNSFWRVHTHNMLNETLTNPGCSIMSKPFNIFGKILFVLADRARELNDPELNSLCCRLTLYAESDPESPHYNKNLVDPLLKKYAQKLVERLSKIE